MYLLVDPVYELQDEKLAELHKETVPPPRQTDEVKKEGGEAMRPWVLQVQFYPWDLSSLVCGKAPVLWEKAPLPVQWRSICLLACF